MISKQEFLDLLVEKTGLKKRECEKLLKAYHEIVIETLEKQEDIRFVGFGTYTVAFRKARISVSPSTGEKIESAAHYVPVFKYGKAVKQAIVEAIPVEKVNNKSAKAKKMIVKRDGDF